jgi:hypothetical protein
VTVYIGSIERATSLKGWRIQSATFSGFMLQLLMVRSVHFASRFHACKDKVERTLLVRVRAIATTKLDLLFGTLQGTAVALLFVTTGLLINLTLMVYRATRSSTLPLVEGQSRASA